IVAVQNLLILWLYRYWGKSPDPSPRLLWCIILSVALFAITFASFVFFSRDTYRESNVDVSPIAELNSEDIRHMEAVLEQLRASGTLRPYYVQERPGAAQLREVHNFVWRKDDGNSVGVSVSIFLTERGAIDFAPHEAEYRNSSKTSVRSDTERRTYIFFSNGTEAILGDSRMIGYDSNLWFPITQRQLITSIRLKNIRINMSEALHYLDLENPITSEFIKLLVEMLKENSAG
ncbi:MAG: hypothetical protein LBC73_05280, partial [Oscillospiraceae bacterium]|nr:hypothetical protein [Oscillospiraceae bacterium]